MRTEIAFSVLAHQAVVEACPGPISRVPLRRTGGVASAISIRVRPSKEITLSLLPSSPRLRQSED